VLPLDTFTPRPAAVMAVVGDPGAVPAPVRDFQPLVDAAAGRSVALEALERFAFYERARAAFAVVVTGERRAYGNILLVKGVVSAA
jgi:L-fucose mutarotase